MAYDDGWEKWINSRDMEALRWAIDYLRKHDTLLLPPDQYLPPELDQLRARLLKAIRETQLSSDRRQRINNAWRQAKYRKDIGRQKKTLSVYAISKDAKSQLAKLAREDGTTIHKMLEKLIKQASAQKEVKEKRLRIEGYNRDKLEGMSPSSYLQAPPTAHHQVKPKLPQGRYMEAPDYETDTGNTDTELTEESAIEEAKRTEHSSEPSSSSSEEEENPGIRKINLIRKRPSKTVIRQIEGDPTETPSEPAPSE